MQVCSSALVLTFADCAKLGALLPKSLFRVSRSDEVGAAYFSRFNKYPAAEVGARLLA